MVGHSNDEYVVRAYQKSTDGTGEVRLETTAGRTWRTVHPWEPWLTGEWRGELDSQGRITNIR